MSKRKPIHMTPPQLISVLNLSENLSDDDGLAMTLAIGKQLALHIAPIHGMVPSIEYVKKGQRGSPDGCPARLLSGKPTVPGALGYHDEGDDGIPFIELFLDLIASQGGKVLEGDDSISSVLSHETSELVGDSAANKWFDGPNGQDYAGELSDTVQGFSYVIDGVSVQNFVYPAFFDQRAQKGSKFDFMGKITHPFETGPRGYQIVRTEPGRVSQVFGRVGHEGVETRPGSGIHLHFGEGFADWKKEGALYKAHKRRARKSV
jgi:hypothetical protein